MSRFVIYPYKLASRSGNALRDALNGHKVRPDGNYRYREGDIIINWGNGTRPVWASNDAYDNILNVPELVSVASNKLKTFRLFSQEEVPTLEWTEDVDVARAWLGEGNSVYARTVLQGHSGEGIVIVRPGGTLPRAPLYTKAIQNDGEYRVHVFQGRVIDYRKKSRQEGDEPNEDQSAIRTLGTGWVYRRDNLRRLERIEQLAVQAMEALGLDFGAVDIIKKPDGSVYVLEINTAIGLEERTLDVYTEAFNSLNQE